MLYWDLSLREFDEDNEPDDKDHREDVKGELEGTFDHFARGAGHGVRDPFLPSG